MVSGRLVTRTKQRNSCGSSKGAGTTPSLSSPSAAAFGAAPRDATPCACAGAAMFIAAGECVAGPLCAAAGSTTAPAGGGSAASAGGGTVSANGDDGRCGSHAGDGCRMLAGCAADGHSAAGAASGNSQSSDRCLTSGASRSSENMSEEVNKGTQCRVSSTCTWQMLHMPGSNQAAVREDEAVSLKTGGVPCDHSLLIANQTKKGLTPLEGVGPALKYIF